MAALNSANTGPRPPRGHPGEARNRGLFLQERLAAARDGRERLAAASDFVRASFKNASDHEINQVVARLIEIASEQEGENRDSQ